MLLMIAADGLNLQLENHFIVKNVKGVITTEMVRTGVNKGYEITNGKARFPL